MTEKNTSNNPIQEILVVDKPQDIRLIFSKKHNTILNLVARSELSISDISRSLNMNPGSVHYHIKELEKHGLVRLVREEVKGGIVKKYYRSVAKRILLDSPDFSGMAQPGDFHSEQYMEKLIKSIEYLGYNLPPENLEDAKDLLARHDKRIRELLRDIQRSGIEDVEVDGLVLQSAYHLMVNIRARDDPEMGRIYGEFKKLFVPYE